MSAYGPPPPGYGGPSAAPSQPPAAAPGGPASYPPAAGGADLESFSIEIPQSIVGLVIGRSGDKIKELQDQSGASIQVAKEEDFTNKEFRPVNVIGTAQQCQLAKQLILQIVRDVRSVWPRSSCDTVSPFLTFDAGANARSSDEPEL